MFLISFIYPDAIIRNFYTYIIFCRESFNINNRFFV